MPPKRPASASPVRKAGAKKPSAKPAAAGRAASTSPTAKKSAKKGGAKPAAKASSPKKAAPKKLPQPPPPPEPFRLQLIGDEWAPEEKIFITVQQNLPLASSTPSLERALQVASLVGLTFHKASKSDQSKPGPTRVHLDRPLEDCKVTGEGVVYVRIDRSNEVPIFLMRSEGSYGTFDPTRRVYVPLHSPIGEKLPDMHRKLGIAPAEAKDYIPLWAQGIPDTTGLHPTKIGVALKKTPAQLSLRGGVVIWFMKPGEPGAPSIGERAAQVPLPQPIPALLREPSPGAKRLIEDGEAFDAASRWRLGQYRVEKEIYFDEHDTPVDPPSPQLVQKLQEAWSHVSPARARHEEEARRVAAAHGEAGLFPQEAPVPKDKRRTPSAPRPRGWRASPPARQVLAYLDQRNNPDRVKPGEVEEHLGYPEAPASFAWLGDDPRNVLSDAPGSRGYARAFRREGDRSLLNDPAVLDRLWETRKRQVWEEVGDNVRQVRLEGTVPLGTAVVVAALALAAEMTRRMWWAPPPEKQINIEGIKCADAATPRFHAAVTRRRRVLRKVLEEAGQRRLLADEIRDLLALLAHPPRESLLHLPEEEYPNQRVLGQLRELQQAFTLISTMPTCMGMLEEKTRLKITYFLEHPLREARRYREVWEAEERADAAKILQLERELFSSPEGGEGSLRSPSASPPPPGGSGRWPHALPPPPLQPSPTPLRVEPLASSSPPRRPVAEEVPGAGEALRPGSLLNSVAGVARSAGRAGGVGAAGQGGAGSMLCGTGVPASPPRQPEPKASPRQAKASPKGRSSPQTPPSPRPQAPPSPASPPLRPDVLPLRSENREAKRNKNVSLYSASTQYRGPIKDAALSEPATLTLSSRPATYRGESPSQPRPSLTRRNSDLDLLGRGRNPSLVPRSREKGESVGAHLSLQERLLPPTIGVDEASLWCAFECFYGLHAPGEMWRASSLVSTVLANCTLSSLAGHRSAVLGEMCRKYGQPEGAWVSDVWPPPGVVRHILHSFYKAYDPVNVEKADELARNLSQGDERFTELQFLLESLCDRWAVNGACFEDWRGVYPTCLQLAHR